MKTIVERGGVPLSERGQGFSQRNIKMRLLFQKKREKVRNKV